MADPKTEALREMAAHRGLKLKTSRRRKPGGDFGRYGLTDAAGAGVLGVGADGLTMTAADIEDYLRGAMRADWAGSTKGLKRRKAPPEPEPKTPKPKTPKPKTPKPRPPEPEPRFEPAVGNLLARLPAARREEAFTHIVSAPGVRIERIVSAGQTTPDDAPMVQDRAEWVLLLQGEARLRIADSAEVTLKAGDHLTIAAGTPHWVTFTTRAPQAVWLAIHYSA